MSITLMDFWPPHQPTIGDFYPDGFVFKKAPTPKRSIGPDAAAVVTALAQRLKCAADAEIELLTIMEFCDSLLRQNGVKMRVTYERNSLPVTAEPDPSEGKA